VPTTRVDSGDGSSCSRGRRQAEDTAPTRAPVGRKQSIVKVVVDYDLCEGNAVCMGVMPEVFDVRDDGFLYLLEENPPESLRSKLQEAVRLCPKQAISIGDD
jgi:ferredoxin